MRLGRGRNLLLGLYLLASPSPQSQTRVRFCITVCWPSWVHRQPPSCNCNCTSPHRLILNLYSHSSHQIPQSFPLDLSQLLNPTHSLTHSLTPQTHSRQKEERSTPIPKQGRRHIIMYSTHDQRCINNPFLSVSFVRTNAGAIESEEHKYMHHVAFWSLHYYRT